MVPNIAEQLLLCVLLLAIGAIAPIILAAERALIARIKQGLALRVAADLVIGAVTILTIYALVFALSNGKLNVYHALIPIAGYGIFRLVKRSILAIRSRHHNRNVDKSQ